MSEETLYLGEYDKLADLGRGGQSLVAKVRHHKYGYIRAVSILCALSPEGRPTPLYVKNDTTDENWRKFEERCGRLLRLCNGNHPNIVHCYRLKYYDHQAFFEMDFINGDNLFQFLKKNDYFIPIEEVLHMAVQISYALSFCHYDTYEYCMNPDEDKDPNTGECLVKADENDSKKLVPVNEDAQLKLIEKHQVVHNDISSKNIMRRNDGTFVLIDFGLSVEGGDVVATNSIRREAGHPEYKAPERWEGKKPTPQSDIYSFGIVLYECLAGHVPFPLPPKEHYSTEDFRQLDLSHHNEIVPHVLEERRRSFENKFLGQVYQKENDFDWLEKTIYKCLEKAPNKRFKDGKELYGHIQSNLNKDSSVYKEEELKRLKKTNERLSSIENEYKLLTKNLKEWGICRHCGYKAVSPNAIGCRNCGREF